MSKQLTTMLEFEVNDRIHSKDPDKVKCDKCRRWVGKATVGRGANGEPYCRPCGERLRAEQEHRMASKKDC